MERDIPPFPDQVKAVIPLTAISEHASKQGIPAELRVHCASVFPGPTTVLLLPQPISPAASSTGNGHTHRFSDSSLRFECGTAGDAGRAAAR
jgi:hypothetical protein